jgi:hypothetical protein
MTELAANVAKSERKILQVLNHHAGRIQMRNLFDEMEKAGLEDETLTRLAIWNLISEARVKRDADTISLAR